MNEYQVAKIVNLTAQLLEEKDVHTKYNIVGDKTIYAKEGLYVGDFNPAYEFFIKGRGCVVGDLVIKGNLFYENNGSGLQQSFCDVFAKPGKPAGFRIRDDIQAKGFMWDTKEEEFVIGDEKYFENRNLSNLQNIRFKNANFMNSYCKNILLESTIISTHSSNNINVEGNLVIKGTIKLDGILTTPNEVLNIKSQLITKSLKIEGGLDVESDIKTMKNINSYGLDCQTLKSDDIFGNNIVINNELKVNQNTEIGGYFLAKKGGEFGSGLEVKGNIYCGKSLIFTEPNAGIAFSKLTPIENASVSYINNKKIPNQGELVNTLESQELFNKSLGTNLDAKYNKITNIDNPTDNYDAVNKKYVDQFIVGGHLLEPTRLGTTEKLDAVFMASSYQLISKKMEALIIDGIEAKIGDRILVKNQNLLVENGIYVVISKGHKNQQWILQLADDCAEILKTKPRIVPLVLVKYGEKNGKKLFGVNFMTQSIWEFLGQEEFVNISFLERLDELENKISKILKKNNPIINSNE